LKVVRSGWKMVHCQNAVEMYNLEIQKSEFLIENNIFWYALWENHQNFVIFIFCFHATSRRLKTKRNILKSKNFQNSPFIINPFSNLFYRRTKICNVNIHYFTYFSVVCYFAKIWKLVSSLTLSLIIINVHEFSWFLNRFCDRK